MRISDWSSDVCSSDLGEDTCFVGYDGLSAEAKVLALYRDGQAVDALNVGDAGVVVLDNTPFYAESGGQVGDRGTIGSFDVQDTQKLKGSVFGHHGVQKDGTLNVGDRVKRSERRRVGQECVRTCRSRWSPKHSKKKTKKNTK